MFKINITKAQIKKATKKQLDQLWMIARRLKDDIDDEIYLREEKRMKQVKRELRKEGY